MAEQKNKNNLNFLDDYKIFAGVALFIAILAYVLAKTELGATIGTTADLGAVGDFFGGILNPTFALIGLFALLATIKMQSKALDISSEELVNSRKELELTRKELFKSANAQQEQSESIKQQNFESTFFNMLDLHNKNIDNISLVKLAKDEKYSRGIVYGCYEINKYKIDTIIRNKILRTAQRHDNNILKDKENYVFDDKDYNSKKAIDRLVSILIRYMTNKREINLEQLYEDFHNEYQEIIGHYFGTIYQILKFINDSDIENKERYSSLFRSQFSKSELQLLFYHGTSKIARRRFAPLLIKFEFFEHLSYIENINDYYISFYTELVLAVNKNSVKSKVFGENKEWKEHIIKTN